MLVSLLAGLAPTLDEEGEADRKLTGIAESEVMSR